MATQRVPRNSGHLSVANTLAAQATPPGMGGSVRTLPTLNGMRAPPPPAPLNRPAMPPGGAVSAGPPAPMGAAAPPTDLRAILAKLFQGGGGGGGGAPPLG